MPPRTARSTATRVKQAPSSDGSTAIRIQGFTLQPGGLLLSRFRTTKLVPDQQWASSDPDITRYAIALIHAKRNGVTPELIVLSGIGIYRYAPWTRDTSGGWEELLEFRDYGSAGETVAAPQGLATAPSWVQVGNRIIFTWGDGSAPRVIDMDTWMVRRMGSSGAPGTPTVRGPTRNSDGANAGGWSVPGRLGTTDGGWTDTSGAVVGGMDRGSWQWAVVFEHTGGAYSPMSPLSAPAGVELQVADPSGTPAVQLESLTRSFQVTVPGGPASVVARIVLRTPNLLRLPPGDFGEPRFLTRISNNTATVVINDGYPDGELGAQPWPDRTVIPGADVVAFHSGSLWVAHNGRLYFSEQTSVLGPVPESFLDSHWRDLPGQIRALHSIRPMSWPGDRMPMLVLTDTDAWMATGEYPTFQVGILQSGAGCAGPQLIQPTPNGGAIWYGQGTFWYAGDGAVQDIASADLRAELLKVSRALVTRCCSWVVADTKEVVFALPTGTGFIHFVWSESGWRFGHPMSVTAAVNISDPPVLVLAGTPPGGTGSAQSVWVMDRGDPLNPGAWTAAWVYQTGWLSPFHPAFVPQTTRQLVLLAKETSLDSTGSAATYTDWRQGIPSTEAQSILATTPDSSGGDLRADLEVWGGHNRQGIWGTSTWRQSRPFLQRVPIADTDAHVVSVYMSGDGDFGLYTQDLEVIGTAPTGKRVPDSTLYGS